jgi:tetratricopeptide (TPR) repeat protein
MKRQKVAPNLLGLMWLACLWIGTGTIPCSAQGNPPSQDSSAKSTEGQKRVKSHDSVTVTANFTPEELEEGKINNVYQSVSILEEKGDCDTAVQKYKSEVIPLAETSKFNIPKNKFLFLANRGIGNCYIAQHRYEEAEQIFLKIMDYLPVWPGIDDSDYPINFRQIATAQMGQQHWQAAEESLKKSVALFDPQIEKALKSEYEFSRTEHAGNLRGSKARSLAYLGIVYMREGRTPEALQTVDLAYEQAKEPHVPVTLLNETIKIGSMIAQASNDKDAISKWSQRSPNPK